jgi:hypothetical protein
MKRQPASQRTTIAAVLIGGGFFLCACLALALIVANWPTSTGDQPEQHSLLERIVTPLSPLHTHRKGATNSRSSSERFNSQKQRIGGQTMQVAPG